MADDSALVGIKADKEITLQKQDKWVKVSAPEQIETPKTPSTLVDELNNQVRQQIAKEIADGYVTKKINTPTSEKDFLAQMVEIAYELSGAGGQDTQLAQVFARHDRFNRAMVPKNAIFSGYTFFSRPCLCLADWNLIGERKFAALKTEDATSVPFAIRCMLDTRFCRESPIAGSCPLIDRQNPFFTILSNGLKSISGFQDPNLVTETTEGGFFSEDQTYVIGGDRLHRTYDFQCQFREYPGSPITAIFDYWYQYMANLQDGSMQQYSEAIDANRIDYTVSIYRFLMDRTNRYIQRWAKCTGCYPVAPPTGVPFNLNEGEFMVNAASEFTVPFKVNRIEYDDPVILKEFNMLVRRYNSSIATGGAQMAFSQRPQNNFCGIPYIRPSLHGFELLWLRRSDLSDERDIVSSGGEISDIGKNIL